MDNQPVPEMTACQFCRFSRLVRADPTALTRVRVCFLMPPTPLMAIGPNGQPMLLPSSHAPVNDQDFCAQFLCRAENVSDVHENSPRVTVNDAPKLLS